MNRTLMILIREFIDIPDMIGLDTDEEVFTWFKSSQPWECQQYEAIADEIDNYGTNSKGETL